MANITNWNYNPIMGKIPGPIFKHFKANTIFKATILAGIFQVILLTLVLFTKNAIDNYTKDKSAALNYGLTIVDILFSVIITYFVMYILFGYGGGDTCTPGLNC